LDKVDWSLLSSNKNAINLLKQNPDKIDWNCLNSNKNAINILKNNLDKLNISYLINNNNVEAILLIEKNLDKIYNHILYSFIWSLLSKNPAIFTYDYEMMRKNNEEFEEELIKEVMKPSRIFKMIEKYGDEYLDILYG